MLERQDCGVVLLLKARLLERVADDRRGGSDQDLRQPRIGRTQVNAAEESLSGSLETLLVDQLQEVIGCSLRVEQVARQDATAGDRSPDRAPVAVESQDR